MSVICFDLEGPLATQDNAYELMKLFPDGGRIFEVISRYDDLLTLVARFDYEPGDTLALIAPFLVCHGIKEHDISALARKATLTPGAVSLISRLSAQGWKIFCISTSYEQYAKRVAHRLGIFSQHVASTSFPLEKFSKELSEEDFRFLETLEKDILNRYPIDDNWIKKRLDRFYWKELPRTGLGRLVQQVQPVGGQRKVEALRHFAEAQKQPLPCWVVVGDSITDFKMLQAVDQAGGLAVAFNANEYALPYATIGLASTHLDDLRPVLEVWKKGKRSAVEKLVREEEKAGGNDDRGYFHWLSGIKSIAVPLEVHKRIRCVVREEAAKLG
ncbi:MAG: HAD family hydrolase [Dehalococcoidia bacterium]|jgi:energy-converting hydrogenase A subunit R